MPRNLLTAPLINYCGTGTTFGALTGLTPDFPNVQDAVNNLYTTIDCGGQQVELRILDGSVDPGFRFSGLPVGQRGFTGVVVRGSALGSAIIRPSGGGAAVALDSGAMISIAELQMDCAVQAAAGHPQDVIQMGQGARIALFGNNRIIQNSYSYNGITLQNSNMDIFPQSWGSQIQNGGYLYWQGQYQAGIQTDQCANIQADCNGQHGLIAFFMESSVYRVKPYWAVDFADIASGVAVLSGIDFHGTADGYRYRIRKGGTLDLNLVQDPNQVNSLPGSASTAWPVQGYLI